MAEKITLYIDCTKKSHIKQELSEKSRSTTAAEQAPFPEAYSIHGI